MFALQIACPEARVETLCDALEALDALSVSVEDADARTSAEQALFGEPGQPVPAQGWARSRLTALFADETAAREAARLLAVQDFFAGCALAALEPVPDQDWVRLTQAQFEPVAITPDFWIVPTWHHPPAQARTIIRLDPGLAFGTGTHPTTRMCLRWIAAHPQPGQRVLDYGCGSGILAIGAALHGARQTDAVDIDPAAVQATRDNAQANGVAEVIAAGLPDMACGGYDVVLANILATPLKLLAPLLAAHVADGGALVLAGILERQTAELQAAYQPWLALDVADTQEGWVLLAARRG
ncbi:MAG: 50S ribosomal protein L11 methyltransferase [Burkholderiaceae bacterium]|jgi:ribosomal protein L11 methyltransferase|nr:50S ribosomal protein L11 methyltransferase [Burkholderiaceae bacterium]